MRLLAKNYPFRELWWGVPLVVMYDLLAVSYALIARRDGHALRGRIAGLAALGGALRLRQPLKDRPDIRFLSPVVAPWRVPARYGHLASRK